MEAVPKLLYCCHSPSPPPFSSSHHFLLPPTPIPKFNSLSLLSNSSATTGVRQPHKSNRLQHLQSINATMLHHNPLVSDLYASALSSSIALLLLRFWGETATRRIFDQGRFLHYYFNICLCMPTIICEFKKSHCATQSNTTEPRISPFDIMLVGNPIVSNGSAAIATVLVIFAFLQLWKEAAKLGLDQKLNRKLVHISIGLVFMLCWPLFSSGHRGAILAALAPAVNIVRMLFLGIGIYKDEATVKSMSRFGDHRELLKGPLYYALTITMSCAIYWRTSPIAIAAICNLCAGDGIADVVGRRFGNQKLPYNQNKSIAGSVAMFLGGFLASLMFMYYFSIFGYVQTSWDMVVGFLVISLASAIVESLPISTTLDDNLTVSLTSILIGSLVF